MVERRVEGARVGGSTPSLSTKGRPLGRRDALQATQAGFDSQSVHQFIPVNRPWWTGLTVNQDAAGSNPATGANCDVLLAARHLRSQRSNMGSSPIRRATCLQDARERTFVLPVAQLDERPATNREACRFDPCREGQFNRV